MVKIVSLSVAPLQSYKGTERFIIDVGDYMVRRGHEFTHFNNTNFTGEMLNNSLEVDFSVVNLHYRRFRTWYFIPKKLIDNFSPDVVYLSTFNSFPLIPFYGYKTIFGTHVFGSEDFCDSSGKYSSEFRLKAAALKAMAILAYDRKKVTIHVLNTSQKFWVESLGFKGYNIRIIPNPIRCEKYTPRPSEWNVDDKFNILFIGGLGVSKGFLEFIEIVKILNSTVYGGKFSFHIVGVGSLTKEARELALNYPNVHYYGAINDDEKVFLYNRCELLVSPSHAENFHVVSAEAQLCGLPVISNDLSGPREIIVDGVTGSLVPGNNLNVFVKNIINYFDIWNSNHSEFNQIRWQSHENALRFCSVRVLPEIEKMILDLD